MSREHGEIAGHLPVLPDGFGPNGFSDPTRINIVLLAEGFTEDEASVFQALCVDFVGWLHHQPWFDVIAKAFLFHAVTIHSDETGIDDLRPEDADDHVLKDTFFDAHLGGFWASNKDRIIYDKGLVRDICNETVPEWRAAVVFANTEDGVANASYADMTAIVPALRSDRGDTILHELGHALFGLADEYDTYLGCGVDTDRDERPWWYLFEPDRPNITIETRRDHIKWRHHIPDEVEIPTAERTVCSSCDDYPNPLAENDALADDSIGLFEGAGTYHCGIFRPAYRCIMNKGSLPFCAVCMETVHQEVRAIFGDKPAVGISPREDLTLNACVGDSESLPVPFQIGNFGNTSERLKLTATHDGFRFTPPDEFDLAPGQTLDASLKFDAQGTSQPTEIQASFQAVEATSGESLTDPVAVAVSVCNPHPRRELYPPLSDATRGDIHFGQIVRGHSSYRRLRVSNMATCCSAPLEVRIDTMPDYFSIEGGLPFSISLPAPAADETRTLLNLWFRCDSDQSGPINNGFGYPVDIAFPELGETIQYWLKVTVVDPPPFDAVLAIDRSASMASPIAEELPRRLDIAFEAASIFTGLLRVGDQIGLVRYNQTATTANGDLLANLQPAGVLEVGAGREAVRQHLSDSAENFRPTGSTSLGAGALLASQALNQGATDRRFMLLLTDGLANTAPSIATAAQQAAQQDPPQRVYVVAIHAEDMSEELSELHLGSLGVVMVTGALVDEHEFLLHKFYTQIMADEAGLSFVYDPVDTVPPGAQQATDIYMGETDYAADFIIACHPAGIFPKYLIATLETPKGTIITKDNHHTIKGVTLVSEPNRGWLYFRCDFREMAEGEGASIGRWRTIVKNDADSALLRYSMMCTADSDFRLDGEVRQSGYSPNSTIEIILRPSLYDRPVELDPPVVVRVTQPDDYVRLVTLDATQDGEYRTVFTHTSLPGRYLVSAEVTATSPQGIIVTRARYMTGMIVYSKETADKPDQGGKPPTLADLIATILNSIWKSMRKVLPGRRTSSPT